MRSQDSGYLWGGPREELLGESVKGDSGVLVVIYSHGIYFMLTH